MAAKDSNKDFSEFFKLFKKKDKDKNTAEDDAEARAAAKKAAAQRVKNLKMLSGIWKQSKITAGATKVISTATNKIMSKWKILAGLALFAMPKEFWGKLKDGVFKLWNFLSTLDWDKIIDDAFKGLKTVIETLVPVVKWIGKKIFGTTATEAQFKALKQKPGESIDDFKKRQDSMGTYENGKFVGKRQGGLLGENRSWGDVITGLALLAAALAPTSALMLGIGILKSGVGALTTILKMGGASILTGPVAAIGAFIAGAGHAISEGLEGADLAKEWKVDKVDGFIGGMIGTTEKGITGMWKNALGKGAIGAGAGFLIGGPVGALVGGLLGAAFGAVTGYIGGERIAKWVNSTKKATIKAWDNMWSAMDNVADSIIKGLRAVLPESWTKNLRTKSEREEFAKRDAVGGNITQLSKEEQNALEKKKQKEALKKEEGMAAHYKNIGKKLEVAEADKAKWETKLSQMHQFRTHQKGVLNDVQKATEADYELKRKNAAALVLRLKEQKKNQEDWEKQQKKGDMTTDALGIHFAKKQTRASSWTGQTGMTKNKMATLASMFKGGIDVTSGFRTEESGDKAMLGSTSDFHKTYGAKTMKGIKDFGQPNSQERKDAIARMRLNGFQSQHEHGNAIDFSYPHGYTKATFPQLEKDILGVFPGANLIQEKDHLHMSFSDKALTNQSGRALQELQAQNNTLNRSGGGSGTSVNVGGATNISSATSNHLSVAPTGQNAADVQNIKYVTR
jgi:hypothetical protein